MAQMKLKRWLMNTLVWPDLTLPPINLWSLPNYMSLYKCPHCNVQRDTEELHPQCIHGKAKVNMQAVIVVKPSFKDMSDKIRIAKNGGNND
jgi:hypothetical protein